MGEIVVKSGGKALTQKFVDEAPVGRHRDQNGLSLIVKSSGQGSWEWRGQRNGKRHEVGIGSSSVVRLAKARDMAAKLRLVLSEGGSKDDLLAAIGRGKIVEAAKDWALSAVTERCFASLKPSLKGGGEAGRWLSPLRLHVFPALGATSVEEIDAEDIRRTLAPIWTSKHATAEKAVQRLGIIMRFAADEDADVDEMATVKARRLLGVVPKQTKHIPHTRYEDIPVLYQRVCELPASPSTLALRLILLTAQRSGPVRAARVENFDLDAGVWTIPADTLKGRVGKVEDFRCPLSDEAVKVIELALSFARGGNLFAALRGASIVSDVAVSKVLNHLREAGRIHGLRSSFADWATARGLAFDLIERCLQHKVGNEVAQAYRRDDQLEQRRNVMNAWAAFATAERDASQRAGLRVVK